MMAGDGRQPMVANDEVIEGAVEALANLESGRLQSRESRLHGGHKT